MILNSAVGDRVFVSWSGGKDSYLSLLLAQEKGLEPVSLLSFVGEDGMSRSHGLKTEVLKAQAAKLGISLVMETVTWESYEDGFEKAVNRLKKEHRISGAVFGDINLQEHLDWIKKMCKRCKIDYNLPLWQMEERAVSEELIYRGGEAVIVTLRNDLVEESWLGRVMDGSYIDYCEKIGISPCGEGGETHTLVIGGPLFSKPLKYRLGQVERDDTLSRIVLHLS